MLAEGALAVVVHIFMAAFMFAGYPNDGVCALEPAVLASAHWSAPQFSGPGGGRAGLYLCDKRPVRDFLVEAAGAWMPEEQRRVAGLYRASFLVLGVALVAVGAYLMKNFARSLFVVDFQPSDNTIAKRWSWIPGIQLYVPQVSLKQLRYPLIACDRELFDTSHLPWECDYEEWDLYKEVCVCDCVCARARARVCVCVCVIVCVRNVPGDSDQSLLQPKFRRTEISGKHSRGARARVRSSVRARCTCRTRGGWPKGLLRRRSAAGGIFRCTTRSLPAAARSRKWNSPSSTTGVERARWSFNV